MENEVAETTVEAMASEGATAFITPADANEDMPGHQVGLEVGPNEITVLVTTEEGRRADYSIIVTRMALSDDASLAKFTVNDGTADADVMADANNVFAHSVGYNVMQVTVSATAGHADARSVAITSPEDADDNMAGHQVALMVGETEIVATVTAEDGSTDEHTLTVTRAASSDVLLAKFTVNDGTTDTDVMEVDGVFAHSVGYNVMQVTVSATARHADASAAITSPEDADDGMEGHQVDLVVGDENPIVATVTAGDESTMSYTLTVTRAAAATDTDLDKFVVTVGKADPVDVMANDDGEYEYTVAGDVTQVTVEAVPADASASAKITTPDADEDMAGYQVDLKSGANMIEATVTAQDGTEAPYELTVTRTKPGIVVSVEENKIELTEGDDQMYMVSLATQPKSDVTVTIATHTDDDDSADDVTAFLTLSTNSRTFTPSNWDVPQDVKITAVDNDDENSNFENHEVTLTHTAASADTDYEGEAKDVMVDITDNDVEGAQVTLSSSEVTVVEGNTDGTKYDVRLVAKPKANVTVSITWGDDDDVMVTPSELIFTTENWNDPQDVTVTAPDNDVDAADGSVTLTHKATGGGYDAASFNNDEVAVIITDDDEAGVTVIGLAGREIREGGSIMYSVKLDSEPSNGVSILVTAGTYNATFNFSATNWGTAQSGTITVPDDNEQTASRSQPVSFAVAGYVDGTGSAVEQSELSFQIKDKSAAEVIISHTALEIAGGASGQYNVSLTQAPAAGETVTVTVESTALTIDFAPAKVELTDANWEGGESVTLTLGARSAGGTVSNTAAVSTGGDETEAKYRAVSTASIDVTVTVPPSS